MNKKQYENIISKTLNKKELSDKDNLTKVRAILKNLGVDFPKGDISNVRNTLETDDFMGWRRCTAEDALEYIKNGTAVIAIDDEIRIVTESKQVMESSVTVFDSNNQAVLYANSGETTQSGDDPIFDTGVYYINNKFSGKYLCSSSNVPALQSGLISVLGDDIRWKLIVIDTNKYIIVPKSNNSKCLCAVGNNVSLVSRGTGYTENMKWTIDFHVGGLKIRNCGNLKFLTISMSGNTALLGLSSNNDLDDDSCWRIIDVNSYGNNDSFIYRELEAITCVENIELMVGESANIELNMFPSNAFWCSKSNFEINHTGSIEYSNGIILAKSTGTDTLTIKHKVTGIEKYINVVVRPMLIYRTRSREVYGFAEDKNDDDITPIFPEDLLDHTKSEYEICNNGTHISLTDIYTNIIDMNQIPFADRSNEMLSFANSCINDNQGFSMFEGMWNHFLSGTGTDYSNNQLTNTVRNHPKVVAYVNTFIDEILSTYLGNNNSISDLYYDENLWTLPLQRKNQTTVALIDNYQDKNETTVLNTPSFGVSNGNRALSLCLNGLVGVKIEITSYNEDDNGYSGVLKFTFYDHFGLDTPDLAEPKEGFYTSYAPGFRQWYILQHFDNLQSDVLPKPFVTIIQFSASFQGNFAQ